MKEKVLAIVGPTASGKTNLSIEIAKQFNGEIVSADSRQVYRGLDIGTEKITNEEMGGIHHHLIDVIQATETFSVSEYKKLANQAISEIIDRGKLPIIVGGTGFYIDTIIYGTDFPEVPPNVELRTKLEEKDVHDLFGELMLKDPKRASTIDPHNKRRLIRALEIIESLGSVPENNTDNPVYDSLIIGIKTDSDELRSRIQNRLSLTMQKGLIDEVKSLKASGVSWDRLYEFGLEYRIASDYLQGNLSEHEIVPKMVTALSQYAKRQMTWFKRNKDIEWFPLEQKDIIFNLIENFVGNTAK